MRLRLIAVLFIGVALLQSCFTYYPVRSPARIAPSTVVHVAPTAQNPTSVSQRSTFWTNLLDMERGDAAERLWDYAQSEELTSDVELELFNTLAAVYRVGLELSQAYPPTPESDSVDHPPIRWTEQHQNIDVKWNLVLEMSVGPAFDVLWKAALRRELPPTPFTRESLLQDKRAVFPPPVRTFAELVVQYYQMKQI